jgi:peptidoglycan hydrolase-like protein with peptidoglycan-binding domain
MGQAGLLAAAAVGWGLFTYSTILSGSEKQAVQNEITQLRQQSETVTAERDQLAQEKDQTMQASQDLRNVQKQIEAAVQELQQLDALRFSVSQAIEQGRIQLTRSSDRPIDDEDLAVSVTSANSRSKQQIRAAQEALTDFGYGRIEPDGVFGPSTRKAIEAFERAKGLPVRGRLGTAMLQALRDHAASAAQ